MGAGNLSVLSLDCPSLPLHVVSSFWFPRVVNQEKGSLGSPLSLTLLPAPSVVISAHHSYSPCLCLAMLVPHTFAVLVPRLACPSSCSSLTLPYAGRRGSPGWAVGKPET